MIQNDTEAVAKANELGGKGTYIGAGLDDTRSKALDMKVWSLRRAQSLEGSMYFIAEDETLFREAVIHRSPEEHEIATRSAYEASK